MFLIFSLRSQVPHPLYRWATFIFIFIDVYIYICAAVFWVTTCHTHYCQVELSRARTPLFIFNKSPIHVIHTLDAVWLSASCAAGWKAFLWDRFFSSALQKSLGFQEVYSGGHNITTIIIIIILPMTEIVCSGLGGTPCYVCCVCRQAISTEHAVLVCG